MDSGEIVLAHSSEEKLIPDNNGCDCNMNMSNTVENTQTHKNNYDMVMKELKQELSRQDCVCGKKSYLLSSYFYIFI